MNTKITGLLLTVISFLEASSAAYATFPGTNGKIAYTTGEQKILFVNPDGTGLEAIPTPESALAVRVSPDASKILYLGSIPSDPPGGKPCNDLYIINKDGSGHANLTNSCIGAAGFSWSPNGTKIAFTQNFQIWVMNSDGLSKAQVTNSGAAPNWSPDGKKIAYYDVGSVFNESHIFIKDLENNNVMQITPEYQGLLRFQFPNWSPDGTKIALQGSSDNIIFTVNADGSSAQANFITTYGRFPSWSPDGNKIVFSRITNPINDSSAIATININADGTGTGLLQITPAKGNPDWTTLPQTPSVPPENDDFDSATTIAALRFDNEQSTLGATMAADDPNSVCAEKSSNVWYKVTLGQNAKIKATTDGSNYETTLSVYTGSRGSLSQVACNPSSVLVDARAGVTYYFAVGAHNSVGGQLKFSVEAVVPPQNDLLANATVIDKLSYSNEISTLYAGTEAGDPTGCYGITPSVWYRYTPPKTIRVLARTGLSDYHASVNVYTGSPGNLTPVTCGDQGSGSFSAIAGNTYYFGIGAFYGQEGQLRFTVDEGLQINVSINANGSATKAGVATVSGTLTCSKPTSGYINLSLQQKFIRSIAQGSGGTPVACNADKPAPWSVQVISNTFTLFGAGKADTSASAYDFYDPVSSDYASSFASKTISLTGKK